MTVKAAQHSDNRTEWEERSVKYGPSLKSVLFKGLPDIINEHFHKSHLRFIFDCLQDMGEGSSILDIGCGYGRLSLPLITKYPGVRITGLDISPTYARLYEENTSRKAMVGTLETMPPGIGPFDCIICVTVLMYLETHQQAGAVAQLLNHLKKNGKLIMIEPEMSGLCFQTGGGLLKLLPRKDDHATHTGGYCFSKGELRNILTKAGGIILNEQRIPATTLFFLPLCIAGKFLPRSWATAILRAAALLDGLLKHRCLPTLWTFQVITKG